MLKTYREYPDLRRKMVLAYPCWNVYPAKLSDFIEAIQNQDHLGGNLYKINEVSQYFLLCLPAINDSEATQMKKKILYTRHGEAVFINDDFFFEKFSEAGICSSSQKLQVTFERLPQPFAIRLVNFLYRGAGEQLLIVDLARRKVRVAQYTKNNIIMTPNVRGEESDISGEFTFWELNDYGNFSKL